MNLTIFDQETKLKPKTHAPSVPLSSVNSHVHSIRALPPRPNIKSRLQTDCAISIFSACVESKEIDSSDREQIELMRGNLITQHRNKSPLQKEEAHLPFRKQKLSLSRKQSKESHQMQLTPIKNKIQQGQMNQISANTKFLSERTNKNGGSHSKTQKINVYIARSQPRKDISDTPTSLQLKESIKIPINTGSINAIPLKKGDDSARKPKLTLSYNFKSQLQEVKDNKQNISQFNPNSTVNKHTVAKISSQSVMIDQSNMTAKLKNIYEMSRQEDPQYPITNMAHYSDLTGQPQFITIKNYENGSEPEVEKYRSHDNSVYSKVSIRQYTEDQNDPIEAVAENEQSRELFNEYSGIQPDKQRRGIGSYAKTIKTFNESDSRQDEESVVLEHRRNDGGFMACLPLNRGSIKDDSGDDALQLYRRRYSSFGEESSEEPSAFRDRITRYVHQPIEEDENGEERQF